MSEETAVVLVDVQYMWNWKPSEVYLLIDLIKCELPLINNVRKVTRIENNYFKLLQTFVNFAYKLLYLL